MKRALLFAVTIIASITAHAQYGAKDTGQLGGVKIYVGKEFSDDEMRSIKDAQEKNNQRAYGHEHKGFNLFTTTGENINMSSSKGKVTLMAFWEETSHYDLAKLNELNEQYKDNEQFQLVVVTFDSNGLAKKIAEEKLTMKFAMVRYVKDMTDLNYDNGYPSYMILSKANIVWKLGSLHKLDEAKDTIKDLMRL